MNTFPLANELRMLQQGDSWHYDVAGTVTTPDGAATNPLRGSITIAVTQRAIELGREVPAITFTQQLETVGADGHPSMFPAPVGVFCYEQSAESRDVRIVADNLGPMGADRVAEQPQVFYPGRWSEATSYDNRLEFGEHGYVANTLTTVGVDEVTTPLGAFTAWKSPISSESPQMGRIEGTDWWTPQLGAPVQFETVSRGPDGSRIHFLATLTRTNVPV